MLKVKVIATKISNLTDARYFAALGVEALMFDHDKLGIDQILEIREWVAGVDFFQSQDSSPIGVETMNFIPINNLDDFLSTTSIQSCIVNVRKEWPYLTSEDKTQILQKAFVTKSYLIFPIDLQEVKALVDTGRLFGLVVEGGEEEKVGLKSFNELDELFELLEGDF